MTWPFPTQSQQALDKKAENAQELGLDYEPQSTWVGLTVEEIAACCMESTTTQLSFYNAIESKLKEKNNG